MQDFRLSSLDWKFLNRTLFQKKLGGPDKYRTRGNSSYESEITSCYA